MLMFLDHCRILPQNDGENKRRFSCDRAFSAAFAANTATEAAMRINDERSLPACFDHAGVNP
jgi:hypothetical protein